MLVIHQLTWRCVPDLRLRRTFKVNMQNKPNSTALRAPRRRIREKYLVAMSCAAAAACTCSPSAFVTLPAKPPALEGIKGIRSLHEKFTPPVPARAIVEGPAA